jgi:hypothetical protein
MYTNNNEAQNKDIDIKYNDYDTNKIYPIMQNDARSTEYDSLAALMVCEQHQQHQDEGNEYDNYEKNNIRVEDMKIDVIEHAMAVKFDSGCSHNMSGMKGRLLTRIDSHPPVYVKGFNDSKSKVASIGLNEDGMKEFYIPSMSEELVLLCAQEYAQKYGAAVLYKNDGVIIKMNDEELKQFKQVVDQYKVAKKLTAVDRTYEVVEDSSNINYQSSNVAVNVDFKGAHNAQRNEERK